MCCYVVVVVCGYVVLCVVSWCNLLFGVMCYVLAVVVCCYVWLRVMCCCLLLFDVSCRRVL